MDPQLLAMLMGGGGGGGQAGGGIAGITSGVLGGVVGLLQRHSANQWLKNNPQPMESMPEGVLANQRLATTMAAEGLPSEQYNQAVKNIQRQQSDALRYSSDRRGALGSLPYLVDKTNNALGNLDAQNAQARINNQKTLMNVNNQVSGWQDKLFGQNQLQPYLRNYNYRMGELGAGNQNLVGGIDKFSAGVAGLMKGYGGGNNQNNSGDGGVYTPSYSEYINRKY